MRWRAWSQNIKYKPRHGNTRPPLTAITAVIIIINPIDIAVRSRVTIAIAVFQVPVVIVIQTCKPTMRVGGIIPMMKTYWSSRVQRSITIQRVNLLHRTQRWVWRVTCMNLPTNRPSQVIDTRLWSIQIVYLSRETLHRPQRQASIAGRVITNINWVSNILMTTIAVSLNSFLNG